MDWKTTLIQIMLYASIIILCSGFCGGMIVGGIYTSNAEITNSEKIIYSIVAIAISSLFGIWIVWNDIKFWRKIKPLQVPDSYYKRLEMKCVFMAKKAEK